jgi:hypothetical protein
MEDAPSSRHGSGTGQTQQDTDEKGGIQGIHSLDKVGLIHGAW